MINEVLNAPEEGFTVEGTEVGLFYALFITHSILMELITCQLDEQSVLGWNGCYMRQGECCGKGGYQNHLPSGG